MIRPVICYHPYPAPYYMWDTVNMQTKKMPKVPSFDGTSKQWTHVWLSLPSCDFWTAWSAMQPSSVTLPCLHRVWFAFINALSQNGWNMLYVFHVTNTFVTLTLDPTSPITNSQNIASLEHPGLCWCRPITVIKPLSVKPENVFPPMARSLWTQYHQHSMLCSNMQTCIDSRCFHKDAKLPGPTVWGWEWHGRTKAWVPCLSELPDTSWVAVCYCIVGVQLCAG